MAGTLESIRFPGFPLGFLRFPKGVQVFLLGFYLRGLSRLVSEVSAEGQNGNSWQDDHLQNYVWVYVLGLASPNAGVLEDTLMEGMARARGPLCANQRGGGGGVDARKPSIVYICVQPR